MSAAASSNNVYLSDISGQPAATSIVDVKVGEVAVPQARGSIVMEMAPTTPPREDRQNMETVVKQEEVG